VRQAYTAARPPVPLQRRASQPAAGFSGITGMLQRRNGEGTRASSLRPQFSGTHAPAGPGLNDRHPLQHEVKMSVELKPLRPCPEDAVPLRRYQTSLTYAVAFPPPFPASVYTTSGIQVPCALLLVCRRRVQRRIVQVC
jgi:hypothetical protein